MKRNEETEEICLLKMNEQTRMRIGLMPTNRFYYTDERFEDGGSVFMEINGQAHAEFYYELVRRQDQGPWEATFVKGKGYVNFDGKVALAPPFWRGEQV